MESKKKEPSRKDKKVVLKLFKVMFLDSKHEKIYANMFKILILVSQRFLVDKF